MSTFESENFITAACEKLRSKKEDYTQMYYDDKRKK